MSDFPAIFRVRQHFDDPKLGDVNAEVEAQLSRLSLGRRIKPDHTVAIPVGSRGIANVRHIIKAIIDHLKRLGASPFIVTAMGSHGGGTVEGQLRIIENYGINENFCGCPIRASMETVVVCEAAEGFPVHFDRHAYGADHVVVCNRIRPHTQFIGDIESGLMKMMLIGLGKRTGATIYHRAFRDFSFGRIVRSVAHEVLSRCSVVAGVAIVENAWGQTARIEAIPPERFEEREKVLLELARRWMPRLPFRTAGILLIDEVGKNISGTGFDLSVVGRRHHAHKAADEEFPKIKMIGLRDLAEQSYGNAEGMGLAEFCRSRLLEKRDETITRVNSLTSGHHMAAMVPLDFETDRQMLRAMLSQVGLAEPEDATLMWIRNTRDVAEVECSAVYETEATGRDDLEILCKPRPLAFDADGNLCDEQMNQTIRQDD